MNPPSPNPLPPEVTAALQRGNFLEAIKLLRAAGGIDLKQAKSAIEQHVAGSKAPGAQAVHMVLEIPAVVDALRKGNKIEAIRILREKSGLGLEEAKDVIDRAPMQPSAIKQSVPNMSAPPTALPGLSPGEVPQTKGGRWWIAAVIVAGAVLYYVLSGY